MIKGKVDRLFTKDWKGLNGNVVLHSFTLKGDRNFYRLGENKPQFRETDEVAFEADGKGNVTNLEVTKAPVGEPAPTQTGAAVGGATTAAPRAASREGSTQSRDGYWADKETRDLAKEERYQNVVEPRITYSSAQSDAVALVAAALAADALSFGNVNKGARLGMLLEYVDQVTARFANQRMNAAALIAGTAEVAEGTAVDADGGDVQNLDD